MRRLHLLVVALALAVAGCSDDGGTDDGGALPGETTTAPTAPAPTFVGDGSSFCDAMLGVGQVERAADATPEEVLAENQRLIDFLGDAQANTPEDAPADFDALIDDFRLAAQAINDARGDVDAAFAALEEDSPEVVGRLGSSTSHAEAYEFLVDRCGITAP